MLRYKKLIVVLALTIMPAAFPGVPAETLQPNNSQSMEAASAEEWDQFLTELAEAKRLVNTGQTKSARKAFESIKEKFPKVAGIDLDMYIKAELLLSQRKLTKAAKTYDKLLTDYPRTRLRDAALDRLFSIGSAYISGQKIRVLGLFKISGYAEGVKIMEKVTDHAGINSKIGVDAAIAVARYYEKKKQYNEAYLKWWEISLEWQTGTTGRDALLGMAQAKQNIYNSNPVRKRPYYDAACLRSARSYYERFRLLYPEDAKKIGVSEILDQIYEQLAYKEYTIGRYYQKTDHQQAANLYFNMVISDWKGSSAAEMAKDMLDKNPSSD
jgi:outer membrane protein assembly factor BamD (BamD/ComL family)